MRWRGRNQSRPLVAGAEAPALHPKDAASNHWNPEALEPVDPEPWNHSNLNHWHQWNPEPWNPLEPRTTGTQNLWNHWNREPWNPGTLEPASPARYRFFDARFVFDDPDELLRLELLLRELLPLDFLALLLFELLRFELELLFLPPLLRPREDFVSPAFARSLLTVRAAISSARFSPTPRSSSESLMCSYCRLRLALFTPRGGIQTPRAPVAGARSRAARKIVAR